MIRIKNKEEIAIIKEGGKKLANILRQVASEAKPGVDTGELEKLACELIAKAGGRPAFKNYKVGTGNVFPTALCTSINEEIVHAPALPARTLKDGDIIGIDVGMEYPIKKRSADTPKNTHSNLGGYYTDTAITVGVGKIDPEVKKLIDTTKKCLAAGIKQVKPGNTLDDIGTTVQRLAESAGYAVVRELVGHGVGHDIHEEPQVPNYAIKNNGFQNVTLKPGMVIAIEPMINIGGWKIATKEDGLSIMTADKSLSAHFEHTVAVTKEGHEILTKA